MQSASKLYNEIFETLVKIEQSADRVAEKIKINRKDYIHMLVDTMAAPAVTQDITSKIRGVKVEVVEQEEEFIIEESRVMKPLINEVVTQPVVVKIVEKTDSEQLDLFSL